MRGPWPLITLSRVRGQACCPWPLHCGPCSYRCLTDSRVVVCADGSAIYTETDDGDSTAYVGEAAGGSEDMPGGREAQQVERVAEMRAVLECIDKVAAAAVRDVPTDQKIDSATTVPASTAKSGAEVGCYAHALPVDTSSVTLMGHSFGGATALRLAAEMEATDAPMRARALVASDPWISGYDMAKLGTTTAPTLALCTQSMMWPPNDEAVGRVMERISSAGARGGGFAARALGIADAHAHAARGIALYAEATETRHQEVSDYPSLLHPIMSFFAMSGPRNPHATHRQQTAVVVGFLGLVGALASDRASSELCARCETASGLLVAEGSERGSDEGKSDMYAEAKTAEGRYIVHGAAAPDAWKEAERRVRLTYRAAARVKPTKAAAVDGGVAMVAVERPPELLAPDRGGLNELV